MSSEEKYMKLALEKTECVYIVCEYESNGENSRSRLISISPNATPLWHERRRFEIWRPSRLWIMSIQMIERNYTML